MHSTPQLAPDAPWKQRFRLPVFFSPQLATTNPARGLAVSNKDSDAFQLYTWDIPNGRLQQLTHHPGGIWEGWLSTDGQFVFYLEDQQGNEHGHVVRIPYGGGTPLDLTPGMADYTLRGFSLSAAGNRVAFTPVNPDGYHLVCVDLHPDGTVGPPHTLYQSKWETWEAVLSYRGELAAMQSTERAGGMRRYSTIIIDTTSGAQVAELWDGAEHSVEPVAFAPVAGDLRLLLTSTISGYNRPVIWNPQTGERLDPLLAELSGEVKPITWSPDGQQILLLHLHQANEQLYLYHLTEQRLTRLNHPSGSIGGAFFANSGEIWISHEDAAQPPRVISLDQITGDLLHTVLAISDVPAGRPFRSVTFPSSDGVLVQAWVGTPAGPGPFPVIFDTHGGPHFAAFHSFNPTAQAWLDHGFAYITVNYRGSTTFGRAFQEKIWGNIGHWELEDMVAARNWLVAQGIARADAIILEGASYGGFLTLWGLGKRPDLWAGGLAIVPGTDWLVSYEDCSAALQGALRAWFGGTPQEKREQYIASSPITYAEYVQAPVLLIQGRNDTRVPPREAEVYEAKMRALGKPIEVIWYDAGHGSASTEQNIEFQEIMFRFVYKILGPA